MICNQYRQLKKTLVFCVFIALLVPVLTWAHKPFVVEPASSDDYVVVEDPTISSAYYGELTGYAHTYLIASTEPLLLETEILVPDIDGIETNRSGLIVRKREDGRGVEEVARLYPDESSWESYYEPFGGDSYRQGPTFSAEIPPGEYLVEVSTPVNEGKYVLVFGSIEDFSDLSFLELLGRIYEVKKFFDKPTIAVLQSPFYLVPTVVLLVVAFVAWRFIKRRRDNSSAPSSESS